MVESKAHRPKQITWFFQTLAQVEKRESMVDREAM